jgi:hypothetical protein
MIKKMMMHILVEGMVEEEEEGEVAEEAEVETAAAVEQGEEGEAMALVAEGGEVHLVEAVAVVVDRNNSTNACLHLHCYLFIIKLNAI